MVARITDPTERLSGSREAAIERSRGRQPTVVVSRKHPSREAAAEDSSAVAASRLCFVLSPETAGSRPQLRAAATSRLRSVSARAIRDGILYCSTGRRKCGGLFVMQGGSPFHVFEAPAPVRRCGAVDVGTGDAVERAAEATFHASNRIPRPPHRETTDGSGPGLSSSLQKRVAHFF